MKEDTRKEILVRKLSYFLKSAVARGLFLSVGRYPLLQTWARRRQEELNWGWGRWRDSVPQPGW